MNRKAISTHSWVVRIIIISSFLSAVPVSSQVGITGGKGLLRIYDAQTVFTGNLLINPVYLGYITTEDAAGTLEEEKQNSYEDHTLSLGLTLGVFKNLELFTQFVPYQDDQNHVWGPLGDTKVGLKYQISGSASVFQLGVLAFASFATAPTANIRFEPYNSGENGWGTLLLFNLDFKNSSAAFPLKFSFNAGYRDHNWNDRYFHAEIDQFIGGIALKFPIRSSLLYSELSGEVFFNNPSIAFEYNSLRYTQGFRFMGPANLIVDLAVDVGLHKKADKKVKTHTPLIKDYAEWKAIVGVTYSTTLFKYLTPAEKVQKQTEEEEKRKLEEIRKKRKQVAKELEEMRKNLEKKEQKEPQ
ncbi:hypothetical protein GF407_07930 [candidate division KSB1 bacterium]|nr:hypothetical protein [candidate division KSB1 bacterium]